MVKEELSTLLSRDAEVFGISTEEQAAGMVTILVRRDDMVSMDVWAVSSPQ